MIGWLAGVDWQATGVLAIGVWQAIKEWRLRRQKKHSKAEANRVARQLGEMASEVTPNRRRPPTLPPPVVR